jgi:hypothetical protein
MIWVSIFLVGVTCWLVHTHIQDEPRVCVYTHLRRNVTCLLEAKEKASKALALRVMVNRW